MQRNLEHDDIVDVVLAVSEACNNAIEHAYGENGEGPINVSIGRDAETLRVVVEDHGMWRDPTPNDERGRGLMLIRNLMHSTDVDTGLHGTRVSFVRRVAAEPRTDVRLRFRDARNAVIPSPARFPSKRRPPMSMTDTPFELRSNRIGDALVVAVAGEIDMATAPEVSKAISSGQGDAGRVVVDLSKVTFLDSSALNAFVQSQQELVRHDVAFRIVSPVDQAVRNVFEITRLTEPLSVVDSLDEALA